jgi:2-keto-4-pentenoate hydratase
VSRIGWKAGFGSPAALARLGLERPLVGSLYAEGALTDGARVSVGSWTRPLLEAEIAVWVGAGGSIGGLGAAIELADLEFEPDDVERILAGNIFHRHVLLGPVDPSRTTAAQVTCRVFRDGVEAAATDEPEALPGEARGRARGRRRLRRRRAERGARRDRGRRRAAVGRRARSALEGRAAAARLAERGD